LAFENYLEQANEDGLPYCSRAGDLIQPGSFAPQYEFRQLSKAWYNRTGV
jgi:hypothetical protein